MTLMPEAILDYTLNGRQAHRMANRDLAKAPHGVYPCHGEEAWVAISVGSDLEWQALCQATGHPEWDDDPRFSDALARWHHQDDLDNLLATWTQQHDAMEVAHHLQCAGVPAGPSHNAKSLLEDPQLPTPSPTLYSFQLPQLPQRDPARFQPSESDPFQFPDLPTAVDHGLRRLPAVTRSAVNSPRSSWGRTRRSTSC